MSKGLRTLNQAIALLRDLDPEIPAQTLSCFLVIASAKEDLQMRDLQKAMDMASSSISRNVAALSEHHRLGKAGLGLVEAYEDLTDRRNKRVRLTSKGRALEYRLKQLMGD